MPRASTSIGRTVGPAERLLDNWRFFGSPCSRAPRVRPSMAEFSAFAATCGVTTPDFSFATKPTRRSPCRRRARSASPPGAVRSIMSIAARRPAVTRRARVRRRPPAAPRLGQGVAHVAKLRGAAFGLAVKPASGPVTEAWVAFDQACPRQLRSTFRPMMMGSLVRCRRRFSSSRLLPSPPRRTLPSRELEAGGADPHRAAGRPDVVDFGLKLSNEAQRLDQRAVDGEVTVPQAAAAPLLCARIAATSLRDISVVSRRSRLGEDRRYLHEPVDREADKPVEEQIWHRYGSINRRLERTEKRTRTRLARMKLFRLRYLRAAFAGANPPKSASSVASAASTTASTSGSGRYAPDLVFSVMKLYTVAQRPIRPRTSRFSIAEDGTTFAVDEGAVTATGTSATC